MDHTQMFEPGDKISVFLKGGEPLASGVVHSDSGRFVQIECCEAIDSRYNEGSVKVLDKRYYDLSLVEAGDSEAPVGADASTGDEMGMGQDDGAPSAPVAPSPKDKMSEDDVERLLTKIGDTALAGLKGMGLKSGAIYPLMIKINTALKAAISPKS